MCESKAYLSIGGEEQLVMEDVEHIKFDGEKVLVRNILGEEKIVEAYVSEINLMDHKVLLARNQD